MKLKKILSQSNFDSEKIIFIIGDVSETLLNLNNIPEKISLLRLDTDWYKSTKDELVYLYPKLEKNGVLIVDDYGHWQGSKLAVDEFFSDLNIKIEKIDYTGIKIIKTHL
jgi:O-methyltransferase